MYSSNQATACADPTSSFLRHTKKQTLLGKMRSSSLAAVLLSAALLSDVTMLIHVAAFVPHASSPGTTRVVPSHPRAATRVAPPSPRRRRMTGGSSEETRAEDDEDEEEDGEKKVNPYADPNYPDLEFVDYSDPNYRVDQGAGDEFFATDSDGEPSTEEEIEVMREDRRKRNDEFQFQTYYTKILKQGEEFNGEWTIYKTDTFLPDDIAPKDENAAFPRLVKASKPLKVVSKAYKEVLPFSAEGQMPVELERIFHVERVALAEEDPLKAWKDDVDTDSGFRQKRAEPVSEVSPEAQQTELEIMSNTYWPRELRALDFRGPQGIMVVGSAYTIATALDMRGSPVIGDTIDGPFSEYRAELGLMVKDMRLRIKLDYARLDDDKSKEPPLHLRSLTVCREGFNYWPRREGKFRSLSERTASDALFGATGADGGLYDPPPVGSDDQAAQYMILDLEGHATVLFPFLLDQAEKGDQGWVTSLDWAPGTMRYQVDRKVGAGRQLLGLRTLELSEVQTADAEQYRPKDGGKDMRQ